MMKLMVSAVAVAAALGLTACEGMAAGGYGDLDGEVGGASAGSVIPPLPPMPPMGSSFPAQPSPPVTGGPIQTPKPPTATAPTPPATGGPSQMPAPPATKPPPAPAAPAGCSAPTVLLRTEVTGGVEIKCGTPPMAPPPSLKCTLPEQVTFLTRNGVSNFVCMK